jgi:BMFP domain-containing protein YqiC
MTTPKRDFFSDFSAMTSAWVQSLGGVKRNVQDAAQDAIEHYLKTMHLVTREEWDALQARVVSLEEALRAVQATPPKSSKSSPLSKESKTEGKESKPLSRPKKKL